MRCALLLLFGSFIALSAYITCNCAQSCVHADLNGGLRSWKTPIQTGPIKETNYQDREGVEIQNMQLAFSLFQGLIGLCGAVGGEAILLS